MKCHGGFVKDRSRVYAPCMGRHGGLRDVHGAPCRVHNGSVRGSMASTWHLFGGAMVRAMEGPSTTYGASVHMDPPLRLTILQDA